MAVVAERRNKTIRDMAISMGVIIIGVLVIVGLYGGFSFAPAGPRGGVAPTADVQGGFETAGRVTGFEVVVPKKIPADWHPNSFTISKPDPAGAPAAVRGGWLTPSGSFISLIESPAPAAALLTAEIGQAGPSTGSTTSGGAEWTVNPGRRTELAWVRTAGGITLLITGSATPAEFARLAQTVAPA